MVYGFIYKICSERGEKVYVGSTNGLNKRWARHVESFRKGKNRTYARILFEEYGPENCEIKLLETVEFTEETKSLLKEREEFWINSFTKTTNVNRPTTFTPERAAESKKAYYEKNKDSEEFKERANDISKRYYANHKETVLEKAAVYRAENPEKIAETNKKQYEKLKLNEEKYKARVARSLAIVECECGAKVMYGNMPRHKKSAAHQGK